VVTTPVERPGREFWQELIALDAKAPLEDFDLFASFCVSSRRRLGLPTLTVTEIEANGVLGASKEISFRSQSIPQGRTPTVSLRRRRFDIAIHRWSRRPLCMSTDVKAGTSVLLKQQEVTGRV